MTFPMAKTHNSQLTFIVQAKIQVQEASPKEKKRKRNVNDVPNGKNTQHPVYLHSPSRIQDQEASPKEKKRKKHVNYIPNGKATHLPAYPNRPSPIQAQEAPPKEKKVK